MKATLIILWLPWAAIAQYRYDDGSLSLKIDDQNHYGFVNHKDEWIVKPEFDEAEPLLRSNSAIVRKGSEFRFIDATGKWLNEFQFEKVWLTGDNPQLVCYAKMNGKWGALNHQFQIAIPFEYEVIPQDEFTSFYVDNHAYLKPESMFICSRKGKTGAINAKNEVLLPFDYQAVVPYRMGSDQPEFLILQSKGKWGYTKPGKEKEANFPYTDFMDTNLDSTKVFQKNNKWVFVNLFTGKESTQIELPKVNNMEATIDVRHGVKWGLMDTKGNVLTEFLSDWVMPHPQVYSEYVFVPSLYQHATSRYGMLSPDGKRMLEADMLSVYPIDGDFIVERETGFGLVGKTGTWALPPFHSEIKYLCLDLFAPKTSEKYTVVNNYGIKIHADPVDEVNCSGELIFIRKQDHWGMVDKTGKVLIRPRFEELDNKFVNGYALAKFSGHWGLINKEGEVVVPFGYDEVSPDFNYYKTSETEKFKFDGKWYDIRRSL